MTHDPTSLCPGRAAGRGLSRPVLPGAGSLLHFLLLIFSAALLQDCGCKDKQPAGGHGKAPGAMAVTSVEEPDGTEGATQAESARPWADLLADRDALEIGLAPGGRFVDLRHPSGLWSIKDARTAAALELSGGSGITLGKKPLILHIPEEGAGTGVITLVVESDDESTLTVRFAGKGARTSPLGPGTASIPVKRPAASADGAADIEISASSKPGKNPPRILGLWLRESDTPPPPPPSRPAVCGKDKRGLSLQPGQALMATAALPALPSVVAAASGAGRADLLLEVTQDQTGSSAFTFKSDAEEANGLRVLDRAIEKGPWSPVEIRVVLDPHAAGEACIERFEIVERSERAIAPPKPYDGVVLVMTDTMRGDLFSWHAAYRTPHMTVSMPGLEALAERSYRFVRATSHASYTKPSVATMLTGLYPSDHGALGRKHAVPSSVSLITEALQDAGVHTAGILSNYFFNPRFGLRKGWTDAVWTDPFKASIDDALVLDSLETYLEASSFPSPFFLYIHLSGAHAPYAPPQEAREHIASRLLSPSIDPVKTTKVVKVYQTGRAGKIKKQLLEDLTGLYRADAWYHDSIMKRLLGILEKAGIMERAVLLYTSDHGEEFFEHGGLGHGRSLWSEQIDVPLLVHLPGQDKGASVGALAGHVDIAPTVFDCLGLPGSAALPGVSLLALAAGGAAGPEGGARGLLVQHWAGSHGVRAGEFKLLHLPGSGDRLTVQKEGREEAAPAADFPVALRLLRMKEVVLIKSSLAVRETLAVKDGAEEAVLDEETRKQLEELGYIME